MKRMSKCTQQHGWDAFLSWGSERRPGHRVLLDVDSGCRSGEPERLRVTGKLVTAAGLL